MQAYLKMSGATAWQLKRVTATRFRKIPGMLKTWMKRYYSFLKFRYLTRIVMFSKSILSYQGPISFSTIDWLLSEFKLAAEDHDLSFRTYKKMISVMIEALENVTKYSDQFQCNGNSTASSFCPSCQISRNVSNIELITRNPVKKEEVASLRTRIEECEQA